jgi:hypothetical protein
VVNNVVYLAWIMPLGAWLAVTLFRRQGEAPAGRGREQPRLGVGRRWIGSPQSSAS